jgi:hypothetical protein
MRMGAIVAGLVVATAVHAAAQGANVSGAWKMSITSDAGPSEASMNLKQEGSKVTGDLTSDQGTVPLDGTFADNKLKITISIDAGGQALVITMNAALEKDTLKGDLDLGWLGTATWTATRAK